MATSSGSRIAYAAGYYGRLDLLEKNRLIHISPKRFTVYTLPGCIPWVLMLALVGQSVGDNWEQWRHKLGYLDYLVLAAILIGVVYLIVKRRRSSPPVSA